MLMLTRVLPIIVVVAGYTGYQFYREFGPNAGPPATPKAVASLELAAEDRAFTAKLQPYITCVNQTDTNLLKNYRQYRAHVQALLTPAKAGSQSIIVGDTFRHFKVQVYEQGNSIAKDCAVGLDKAVTMTPAEPTLDRLATSYAATVRGLIPLMNEADIYYGQKDHVDDKMAKGRKLDGQIAPLFETLAKLSIEMRAAVAGHENHLQDKRLSAIEKQRGRTLDWHTLNVMIEARRAVASLEVNGGYAAPSTDAVRQAEQNFQAAFDAARAVGEAAPVLAPTTPKPLWSSIQSDAAEVLATIKELRRTLDGSKPPNEVINAANRVVGRYNTLVRSHNMLSRF